MNVHYRDQEIAGERLEWADKESSYFVGPNLVLHRCTVVLGLRSRDLILMPTRFNDCIVECKRQLSGFSWTCAALKGCRFKGRMYGCDFGSWRDYTEGWEFGSVEDCDFSDARLDACRFQGCDMRTLRLPGWPCFTLLDPIQHTEEWNRLEWPGLFGSVIVKNLRAHPPATVALTYHAPSVAQRMETTPEALRALLETLEGVIL